MGVAVACWQMFQGKGAQGKGAGKGATRIWRFC